MYFGREDVGGLAITLLDVDKVIDEGVVKELESLENILSVKKIDLA